MECLLILSKNDIPIGNVVLIIFPKEKSMHNIKVLLCVFESYNKEKYVYIPVDKTTDTNINNLLESVYISGQNDFSNKELNHRSISAGDIIFIEEKIYRVCNIGFEELKIPLNEYLKQDKFLTNF